MSNAINASLFQYDSPCAREIGVLIEVRGSPNKLTIEGTGTNPDSLSPVKN